MVALKQRVIAPSQDQFLMWAQARDLDPQDFRYVTKTDDLAGVDRSVPIIVTGDPAAHDDRPSFARDLGFQLDWQPTLVVPGRGQ